MTPQERQAIYEKIQKLLRLEAGAKAIGSFEEAKAAAAQAQAILNKHNLSAEELASYASTEYDKKTSYEGMEHRYFGNGRFYAKNEGDWMFQLIKVIGHYNFVKTLISVPLKIYGAHLYGETHNIEISYFFFEQLEPIIRRLGKESYKYRSKHEDDFKLRNSNRNAYLRQFYMGAVDGIGVTLQMQLREFKEAQADPQTTALAITNKMDLVEKYMHHVEPRIKARANRGFRTRTDGQSDGYKAGRKISLNKGVGSTNPLGNRLLG